MPSSIMLINPSMRPAWNGCQPYELLLLAAIAEREDHRTRLVDFNVTHLDFGLFADVLRSFAPDWVGITASTPLALEGYRLGRFVKTVLPHSKLIYGGPHPTALPQEPFDVGLADFVAVGDATGTLPALLAGTPAGYLSNVVSRDTPRPLGTGLSPAASNADELPTPAWHQLSLDKYQTPPEWPDDLRGPAADLLTRLDAPVPHHVLQPALATSLSCYRSVEWVLSDIKQLSSLGIRCLRIRDADFLEDADRVHDFCSAIELLPERLHWSCRTTLDTILRRPLLLMRLKAAGCVAIEIAHEHDPHPSSLGGPSTGVARLRREVTQLVRAAGLVPTHCVSAFRPGDSLETAYWHAADIYGCYGEPVLSIPPTKRSLGALIRGGFFAPAPLAATDRQRLAERGLITARCWSQHVPSRVSYLPDDLLDDVPRRTDSRSHEELYATLVANRDLIQSWIDASFYLQPRLLDSFGGLEAYLAAAARLCEAVDGKTSARALFARVEAALGNLEAHCATLSLLSILGFICGRRSEEREPIRHRARFFCSRPWTGFEIGAEDGSVSMCCWAKTEYGNVNQESIAQIWNGPKIRKTRRYMADGRWGEVCQLHCPYIAGYMEDSDPLPLGDAFAANLVKNRQDIETRKEHVESLPRYWKVAHSTLCNLDCVMCYQERNSKQSLPETFYEQLRQYYPFMQELLLTGGEPLMIRRVRRLWQEVVAGRYPDLGVALITNGTIRDDRMVELVRRSRMSWVLVSIDASSPETYEKIRRGGVLTQTLEGVRRWKELKDEMGFQLVLSFTVMRDNVGEIAAFVTLACTLRVDCQFSLVGGTKADQHLIDWARLRAEVDRALGFLVESGRVEQMDVAYSSLLALRDAR